MTDALPLCPNCSSDLAYEMGALLVCPMCGHEWSASEADAAADAEADAGLSKDAVVKDAFGTPLADGDTVSIIKDLKVKGFPQSIKVGMKVRGIRLVDGFDGHNIDCKVDGFGQMQLKASVVKKV